MDEVETSAVEPLLEMPQRSQSNRRSLRSFRQSKSVPDLCVTSQSRQEARRRRLQKCDPTHTPLHTTYRAGRSRSLCRRASAYDELLCPGTLALRLGNPGTLNSELSAVL